MRYKIITHPTEEPFTLEQCRQQLEVQPYEFDSDGVGTHPHDAMILRKLSEARRFCERYTGLSFAPQTLELALDTFPTKAGVSGAIKLPMSPANEIISVSYLDADGAQQVMDPLTYVLDNYSVPGWLMPAADTSWPTTSTGSNTVRIRYIAGYGEGSDLEPIPPDAGSAIMLMLGHLYANRESAVIGTISSELPFGVEAFLTPLRVNFIVAAGGE